MRNITRNTKIIYCLLFFMIVTSCKKNVEPLVNDEQNTYVNFFNASEVLSTNLQLQEANRVYINDSIPNKEFKFYPEFGQGTDNIRQFPDKVSLTGAVDNVTIPSGVGYDVVYWLPLVSAEYRFIYTSVNKEYLKESVVNLTAKSRIAQYLIESPESEDAYQVISVPEERKGVSGKVRVRIVHLGTDAGSLDIKKVKEDGTSEEQGLPQGMSFGQYSEYIELDTSGVSKTGYVIPLRFYKNGTSENILNTSIPAIPNASFVVLVQGFRNATTRRIKTGHQTNGNPVYTTVTVQGNFRTNLRRTF